MRRVWALVPGLGAEELERLKGCLDFGSLCIDDLSALSSTCLFRLWFDVSLSPNYQISIFGSLNEIKNTKTWKHKKQPFFLESVLLHNNPQKNQNYPRG